MEKMDNQSLVTSYSWLLNQPVSLSCHLESHSIHSEEDGIEVIFKKEHDDAAAARLAAEEEAKRLEESKRGRENDDDDDVIAVSNGDVNGDVNAAKRVKTAESEDTNGNGDAAEVVEMDATEVIELEWRAAMLDLMDISELD